MAIADYTSRAWQIGYRDLIVAEALTGLDPADRAENLRQWLTEADVTIVVVELEGQPVGHVLTRRIDDLTGEIVQLYVDPDHWGRGHGQALLGVGTRSLRRWGCRRGRLWTIDGNERAVAMYEQNGWGLDGRARTDRVFGLEINEIGMTRDLLTDDLVAANRAFWDREAEDYVEGGERGWADPEPTWGLFGIHDDRVGALPDLAGKDVVELGCGTGYVAAWALEAGARSAVGLDNSPAQLATAARLSRERKAAFSAVMGDGSQLPFADRSFDVALSEYGASIWCDPHRWIPEAARVLRPGGTLTFLLNSLLLILCAPEFDGEQPDARLARSQRSLGAIEWLDQAAVEYHVSHGEMIAILTGAGFEIVALHELYPPPGVAPSHDIVTREWAAQWPAEEIWVARRR